jgi:hypothetical protein
MYLEKYLLDAKCSEQSYSPLEGDLEERRGRHPPRSGDHQFRLLKGAQFLPVDGDRNIARSTPEPRFENIRHNRLQALHRGIARGCLGRDAALGTSCNPNVRIAVMECVER